jgi:hypothetical protein
MAANFPVKEKSTDEKSILSLLLHVTTEAFE